MQISPKLQLIFETRISLDEFTKSLNSQTNNKSSGKEGLVAELYRLHKLNIPYPSPMFLTPGKGLASWVLCLVQE